MKKAHTGDDMFDSLAYTVFLYSDAALFFFHTATNVSECVHAALLKPIKAIWLYYQLYLSDTI